MGGKRKKQGKRCASCRMLEALCLCPDIPTLETRHRYLFVRHKLEAYKTTNSARLAHAALAGSQLCSYSSRTEPLQPLPKLDPRSPLYLLYPTENCAAFPASSLGSLEPSATFVILDGTWAQTRKMRKTLSFLQDASFVGLPSEAKARLSLREESFSGGMMTLDAVSWLVAGTEGAAAGRALYRLLYTFVSRTLASRGTPLPGGPRWTREGLVFPPPEAKEV